MLASRRVSSSPSFERRSSSISALAAIELTEVPPLTVPTVKVVRGSSGTWTSLISAMARPSACVALGLPKAL